MASKLRAIALLHGVSLALLATVAFADPTPQQKELARDLMQKGRDARTAHDLKLALESFKAADDIMHVPTTGFEVARSQVDLALLVEAHEMLLRVLRSPEAANEPKAFKDARGYAKVLDDEIVPRIPQLRIAVEGVTSDRVRSAVVDGAAIPAAALLIPLKVDPGHHVVVAKTTVGEGRAEVDVRESETKDVIVKITPNGVASSGGVATPPDASSAPATPPEPPPAADAPPPAADNGHGGMPPLAWIGFGVGAAGLVAGTVTGILTFSDKSTLSSQCNGTRCPASANDTLSSASSMATISTISFVVAGVGAGVGLGALLFTKAGPSTPTTGASVTPFIGLGSIGARGSF